MTLLSPPQLPALGAVRARLIRQWLNPDSAAGAFPKVAGGTGAPDTTRDSSVRLPRIVATGRTSSGKSTLGNLLLGARVLTTTGRADCTDAVHVVRFPRGLTYVDLPGVASDDRLENYNRVAFGLPQRPEWPAAGTIRVMSYDGREPAGERSSAEGAVLTGSLAPDLIIYLVAPHRQVVRDEDSYLADLLGRYGGDRILYVLNRFLDSADKPMATPENTQDARRRLTGVHQRAGLELNPDRLVEIDCRTGDGLADLLDAARALLAPQQGRPLADLVAHQNAHTPGVYREEVKAAVVRFAEQLRHMVPASADDGGNVVAVARDLLAEQVEARSGRPVPWWRAGEKALRDLTAEVLDELRQQVSEPVTEERSRDIYEQVPYYDSVEEDDLSRPIYETRRRSRKVAPSDFDGFVDAVGSAFSGDGFATTEWYTEEVVVGYRTRRRDVYAGTRPVHVRTERWTEVVGERLVDVGFSPFGARGVALVLAAWQQVGSAAAGRTTPAGIEAAYRYTLAALHAAGADPVPDPSRTGLDRLFLPDADAMVDTVLGTGS